MSLISTGSISLDSTFKAYKFVSSACVLLFFRIFAWLSVVFLFLNSLITMKILLKILLKIMVLIMLKITIWWPCSEECHGKYFRIICKCKQEKMLMYDFASIKNQNAYRKMLYFFRTKKIYRYHTTLLKLFYKYKLSLDIAGQSTRKNIFCTNRNIKEWMYRKKKLFLVCYR